MTECTLCGQEELVPVFPEHDIRSYFHCQHCDLIFSDARFHLSRNEARSRYSEHNNGIHHEGYVNFLNRAIAPCIPYLNRQMIGLDYGCGPTPTLSRILAGLGFLCHDYDPLFEFSHDETAYDFIFATECFEHFFRPGEEFTKINRLLEYGGYLVIMTERWENLEGFEQWYYKRDPTHVSFYHNNSFDWICHKFGYAPAFNDSNRVLILKKKQVV